MKHRIWLAALMISGFACTRYELRNELDVPGLCDRSRSSSPTGVITRRDSTSTQPRLVRGRVSDRGSGAALAEARVRVLAPSGPVTTLTDSTGSFETSSLPAGRYLVEVLRVGYQRAADTVDLRADGSITVDAQLVPQVLDGPCSGFAAVVVRKPRWKIW